MLRRHLLLSMGASVLAAALPVPVAVFAAPIPDHGVPAATIRSLERIDQALDALETYGFTFVEQRAILGIVPPVASNRSELRFVVQDVVIDHQSPDVIERIDYVISIRKTLDDRLGSKNIVAHRYYLHTAARVWDASARDMMRTGDLVQIRTVALTLGARLT